jgi:hypothetical protein
MKKTEQAALSPALAMVVKVVLACLVMVEGRKGGKNVVTERCVGTVEFLGFGRGGRKR